MQPDRMRLGRLVTRVDALPPAVGALVMATTILSVGLHLLGVDRASLAFLVVALAVWLVLAAVFVRHLLTERDRWRQEADTPPALTAVAATGVVGTRLSLLGWGPVSVLALCLTVVLWPLLMTHVLRHRGRSVPGAAYLVCVATQAIVVLACAVATSSGRHWLLWPALALFVIGILLYVLVLMRFDFGQLGAGAGDHWIIAGAMSISALAGSKLVAASAPHGPLRWAASLHEPLRIATLVLLGVALAWYAVLVCCELRWPRPGYSVRRWSTVFPLGMTAVAALSTSTALAIPWLWTLGKVLLWLAVLVWAVVAAGAVRTLWRAKARPDAGTPVRHN
ncbi:tellurite resistance/C4-dicarboxylate transporter family protein [Streptomyces sp. T-3]|nr:tellurite resistance/C4-dicarboxylate transporter family protein [Streptomyces sp. T-3]